MSYPQVRCLNKPLTGFKFPKYGQLLLFLNPIYGVQLEIPSTAFSPFQLKMCNF
jgi:hypothetical protein